MSEHENTGGLVMPHDGLIVTASLELMQDRMKASLQHVVSMRGDALMTMLDQKIGEFDIEGFIAKEIEWQSKRFVEDHFKNMVRDAFDNVLRQYKFDLQATVEKKVKEAVKVSVRDLKE